MSKTNSKCCLIKRENDLNFCCYLNAQINHKNMKKANFENKWRTQNNIAKRSHFYHYYFSFGLILKNSTWKNHWFDWFKISIFVWRFFFMLKFFKGEKIQNWNCELKECIRWKKNVVKKLYEFAKLTNVMI